MIIKIVQVQVLFSAPKTYPIYKTGMFFILELIYHNHLLIRYNKFMNDSDFSQQLQTISISVRKLAERVHQSGGLATPLYGGVDSLDGIKAHQKFSQQIALQDFPIAGSEIALEGSYNSSAYQLKIRGRLDNITLRENLITLYEIKSFSGNPFYIPKDGEPVHWAQLILYAYLLQNSDHTELASRLKLEQGPTSDNFFEALKNHNIELIVVYAPLENEQYIFKKRVLSQTEIENFVKNTAENYIQRLSSFIEWKSIRDSSIKEATFPFSHIREGQAKMMKEVLAAIRDKDSLICQAATGIGKTMAVLYPSLKAVSVKFADKIFYATGMISTRAVADESIDFLREKGFLIRSILFQAKEQICLQPGLFCDQTICPYAIDYYQRLPDALNALFPHHKITPELIRQIALEYQVCPHELSLDISDYCDILIGDYNHLFDPRAGIRRLFSDDGETCVLLIDEAHNLPARSRNMYSAGIKHEDLIRLRGIIRHPNLHFAVQYMDLLNQIEYIISLCNDFLPLFELKQKPAQNPFFSNGEENWLFDQNFIGVRKKPLLLLNQIRRLSRSLREFLDQQKIFEGRKDVLDIWFDLLFFEKIADFYFDAAYITAIRKNQNKLAEIYFLCLDASAQITSIYAQKNPTIFFSATLSPMHYYHSLLNAKFTDLPSELLDLQSPFNPKNRLFASLTQYKVTYRHREQTLFGISQFILAASQKKVGNYLIFVPSYQYLFQIRQLFTKLTQNGPQKLLPNKFSDDAENPANANSLFSPAEPPQNKPIRLLFQKRKMNEQDKSDFLSAFDEYGGQYLLAFAVLGSHFNEGIDLVGEKLSGVFVIGTGLPQISPERELMSQYYSDKFHAGRAYAYQYPGFNRVQQAVGRLIRNEKDTGFAILIDERYQNPEWQQIYPPDWQIKNFSNSEELLAEIEIFWQDHPTDPKL